MNFHIQGRSGAYGVYRSLDLNKTHRYVNLLDNIGHTVMEV